MKQTYTLILITLGICLLSCKSMKTKSNEYQWQACFQAAANFPSKLYSGYLYNKETGVVLRGGGVDGEDYARWGYGGTSMGGGGKSRTLPTKLHLIWISFVEDQFYEARIDLDTAKINKMFKDGYTHSMRGKVMTLHDYEFIISVAPGGTVALWLEEGFGSFKTEIGFYQQVAKKTDIPWKELVPLGNERDVLVPAMLKNIPPELLKQYREDGIPFDKWENYRRKYNYNLLFREGDKQIFTFWYMFNGEKITINNHFILQNYAGEYMTKALPKQFDILWDEPNGITYHVIVDIPETEIERMSNFFDEHEGKASFYIEPYIPEYVRQIKLFLINGDDKMEVNLAPHEVFKRR
ncbi:MAG: DUF2931 family protein [Bacteroidales bacterium]